MRLPTAKAGGILIRFMLNDVMRLVEISHPAFFVFAKNMKVTMGSL